MEWKKYPYDYLGLEESIQRITDKKNQLDTHRPIPSMVLKSIKESLFLEWTYNSNSIEGNTLTLQETKLVVEEGLTVSGKSLREHFEALNHQEAIAYVEDLVSQNPVIDCSSILNIHALVLQNIEKEYAGRLRSSGVRISGANFVPPNALKVPDLLDDLLLWMQEPHDFHPIIKASIFHHRFVWIHPFFDGNGRTIRLVFNLYLMSLGYPPAIILTHDRKKYYTALNQANQGDYSKLVLVMIQALERSLDIYLSSLTNTYDDYEPIQNIVNDPEVPYGQEYVSLLARTGKIDAFKESRNWLTTKKAVKEYISQRKRQRKLD